MRNELQVCGLIRTAWLSLFLVSSLCGQDSVNRDYSDQLPRIPFTAAEVALGKMELADPRLAIELVACEPLVVDPVAISFDAWGRALVVEMSGYSERADQKLGRIKRLEDTDQDGRFDRAIVVADGFRWPTGVACFQGGILVADAPDILFLKDEDGDGLADTRQILWTGFGTSNVQQLPNNFHWTIDNQIVGASGGNDGQLHRVTPLPRSVIEKVSPDETQPLDMRGRDFCIDPRTLQLSAIAGGTQFGMAFDRWGTRFVCSNSDHCQQIIFEDRYAARNPRHRISRSRINIAPDGAAAEVFRISPVEPWRRVRTRLRVQGLVSGPIEGGGRAAGYFTSATGLTVYDGDGMPEDYRGNLFVGDVGSNLVHRKQLVGEGIQQQAIRTEQGTEFLRSPDNWFRPVQMANAPDGSLVVIDMYRETIEHPDSLPPIIKQHLDLNSGNQRGRLYRIVDRDAARGPRRMPGDANLEQLVDMLEHPNGWHRRTASRLLLETAWSSTADVAARIVSLLQAKLSSTENPEARIRSMYLLASVDHLESSELVRGLRDPHPQVRIHAIRACEGRLGPDLERQLVTMVNDPDIRVRFQLALTLGDLATETAAQIASLANRDGQDPWMQTALASSAYRDRGSVLEQLAREVSWHPDAVDRLRPLMLELVGQLTRDPSGADLKALKNATLVLAGQDKLLLGEFLAELSRMSPSQQERLDAEFEDTDVQLESLVRSVLEFARSEAVNPERPMEHRARAIALLRLDAAEAVSPVVSRLLKLDQAPAIREAAISLAGHFGNLELGSLLLEHLPKFNPTQRSMALQVLLSRPSWTELLMEGIANSKISPALLEASVKQRLLRHVNPAIKQQAVVLFGEKQNRNRRRFVQQYLAEVDPDPGGVDRGRALFRKSCMTCHRLEGQGNEIGPNLAAFSNRGIASMVINILDPNREVDPRYFAFQVVLDDGRLLLGIIESETETSITLKNSEGQSIPLLRAEIEEMKSTTLSLMPDNFGDEINPQQMSDLIGYLLSQGE